MRFRAVFALAGLGAILVGAAAMAAGDPIKDRQALMKKMGGSMKVLGEMAKGAHDYDADAAKSAMTTIHESSLMIVPLFPEGSDTGGDTAALAKIWSDMDEFKEDVMTLEAASAEAIPIVATNLDALRGSLGKVGHACGDCHEDFRQKKK